MILCNIIIFFFGGGGGGYLLRIPLEIQGTREESKI